VPDYVGGTLWAKPFEHYAEAKIEAEVRRSLFPTLWCCHCVAGAGRGLNALTACLALETAAAGFASTPRRIPRNSGKGRNDEMKSLPEDA